MTLYGYRGFELGEPVVYGNGGNAVQRVAPEGAPDGMRYACEETGERYGSLREAACALGVTSSALSKAVRAGRPCMGYTVRRLWD